jgi:uncharacterized Tic20 family protein
MTRTDAPRPMDLEDRGGSWEVREPDGDARTWAVAAHLSSLLFWTPVGPLAVWLLGRHRDRFVDHQGKEALNFQITILLLELAVGLFGLLTFGIGLILLAPLWVWNVVLTVIAAFRNGDGVPYRYPLTLRLVP